MKRAGDIRRQVYDLSVADLSACPAWIFAADEEGRPGQDEATVRPYERSPVDPRDGLVIVRALFTLADASTLSGYVSLPPPGVTWDVRNVQPVIVELARQTQLWFGIAPVSPERVGVLLAGLNRSADQVFPLTYHSDIAHLGPPVRGEAQGFGWLADGRVRWTR